MSFVEGDRAYIVENNLRVTPVRVVRRDGEFYTIRFADFGMISLRESRLYHTEEEAKEKIRQAPAPKKDVSIKGQTTSYQYDNSRSPYGI